MASRRAETGEIDTRAPFESVKAAVSLFGEGAFSKKKPPSRNWPKPPSIKKLVVEEDRVLHLPEKEINIYNVKLQISNAEVTKNKALEELAKAKRTVEELNQKIQKASTSTRESANKSTTTEVENVCEEMFSSFDQLYSEKEAALGKAEEMKKKVEELRIGMESSRRTLEETEEKLRIAHEETEEARASEARALDQVRIISEQQCNSESAKVFTISKEEFAALNQKDEDSSKEIEDMKNATMEALKRAEAAEDEVQRWRKREKKKIAEIASRILEGTEKPYYSSSIFRKATTSFEKKTKMVSGGLRGILSKKNQVARSG